MTPHRLRTPRTPPGALDKRRRERKARSASPSSPSPELLELREEIDRATVAELNRQRAEARRELYHRDPLWRLSKLKDNRERRLRAKLARIAAELRIDRQAKRRQRAEYRPRTPRAGRRGRLLAQAVAGDFARAAA